MLTQFKEKRLGAVYPWTSKSIDAKYLLAQEFVSEAITIRNSLRVAGRQGRFNTWTDDFGAVTGKSIIRPWHQLCNGFELDAGPTQLTVTRRKWAIIDVESHLDSQRFVMHGLSWNNSAVLERANGDLVARFKPMNDSFELDVESLSDADWLMMLAVLESGVHRRARRFGLIATSYWFIGSVG